MARGTLSAKALFIAAGEGSRYLAASALGFAVDFTVYVALIRLAGISYLAAAPIGFALGLALVYALSVRWVFAHRRLDDARIEFFVFAFIGLAGIGVNQLVIYAGVERLSLSYEMAKIAAAAVVFCFNFGLRKLFLFRRA
jgi:putative flippase GtrA